MIVLLTLLIAGVRIAFAVHQWWHGHHMTAIDAVTGDASNMAADVNYTEPMNTGENVGNASEKMPTPRTKTPGKPPLEQPAPDQPVTNNAT